MQQPCRMSLVTNSANDKCAYAGAFIHLCAVMNLNVLGRTLSPEGSKRHGKESLDWSLRLRMRCTVQRSTRRGQSDASRTRHTCTRGKPGHPYTVGTLALAPALVRTVWPLACLLSATGPTRNPPNTPSCPTPYPITRHHAIQVTLSSSGPRRAWYLEAASGATLPTKKNPSTRSLSPW